MRGKSGKITLVLSLLILLGGCSGGRENSGEDMDADQNAQAETRTELQTEIQTEVSFPASYAGGTEKIRIECDLEVPEEFQAQNFYLPKVSGIFSIDRDEVYRIYVEGREEEIEETYVYGSEEAGDLYENYNFAGSTAETMEQVSIYSSGFHFLTEEWFEKYYYQEEAPDDSREEFSFASAQDCIDQTKTALLEVGYPVEQLRFFWFSVNAEEYEALEQKAIERGSLEEDQKGEWSEADNTYEIYAWQTYGGLDVLPWIMSTQYNRAYIQDGMAQVSSSFSMHGMLHISVNQQSTYLLEATEELAKFQPFEAIAKALEERYELFLDEQSYHVERAKLALRVSRDEKQQLIAIPVWYFEVVDERENMEIVLFDALTAEEIILPTG